jgi:hypothetical protein
MSRLVPSYPVAPCPPRSCSSQTYNTALFRAPHSGADSYEFSTRPRSSSHNRLAWSPDHNTALFRAPRSGACLLLVRWFSPCVLTVSFCHMNEPVGTEFQSSTYLLFTIYTGLPTGRAFCLPPACLLVCWTYFFDPENGGDMFLRNVGWNSTDYTASYPRRW